MERLYTSITNKEQNNNYLQTGFWQNVRTLFLNGFG